MRIRWIVSASNVALDASGLESDVASYRYRAAIPLRELAARGHTCDWYALRVGEPVTAGHPALHEADVLVIAKSHAERDEVIALLDEARARGVATVVDTCDDYFSVPHALTPHYRALVARANAVTTSSFRLAGAIEDVTDTEAHVVRDPYEGPEGVPRWSPDAPVKAVWFGTPLNVPALLDAAATLPGRIEGYRVDVDVLTRESDGLEAAFEKLNARAAGKLVLRFTEWSLERNLRALSDCDLALIPVRSDDRFSLAKGPNRLVETLRAGRYAIAGALPAYEEFSPYASVGEDAATAIAWALRNPAEVVERIAAGQAYIRRHYSPQAVAGEWEAALGVALARRG
jgi:glycosyltransferase involved in cell wall biosynthesis